MMAATTLLLLGIGVEGLTFLDGADEDRGKGIPFVGLERGWINIGPILLVVPRTFAPIP